MPAACSSREDTAKTVDFFELVSNPSVFSGTNIYTEGFYLSGFEVSALGADIQELNGYVYLTDPAI